MQPGLTQAFQTALGMLITNDSIADGLIGGQLEVERIHPDLTIPDVEALRALLQADGWKLQAISKIATRRRKKRILDLLPATSKLLRPAIHDHWRAYLAAAGMRGAPPSYEDAAAFAAYLLASAPPVAAPFVRFEWCCSEIAGRIESKSASAGPSCTTPMERVRLSRFVRVERFDFAIDEAMRELRAHRTLRTDWPCAPTHLVFHVLRMKPTLVTTTRLPAALAEALQAANSAGIDVRELCAAASPQLSGAIQQMIAQLVAARLLEAAAYSS